MELYNNSSNVNYIYFIEIKITKTVLLNYVIIYSSKEFISMEYFFNRHILLSIKHFKVVQLGIGTLYRRNLSQDIIAK